jgi:subtilisin family serine protease
VLDCNHDGTYAKIVAGLQWAVEKQGARLVSMSMSLPSKTTPDEIGLFNEILQKLRDHFSALCFVAAGNAGAALEYPAACANAIAITATDSDNVLLTSSNRVVGTTRGSVGFCAPGFTIVVPDDAEPNKQTSVTHSDTSLATPIAVGVACHFLAADPSLKPDELLSKMRSAVTLNKIDPGLYGAGIVHTP